MNRADKAIAYLQEMQEPVSISEDPAPPPVLGYADDQGRVFRVVRDAAPAPPPVSHKVVLARAVNELFAFQEAALAERDAELCRDLIYSTHQRLDALREYAEECAPSARAELGAIWQQIQQERDAHKGAKVYIKTSRTEGGLESVQFSAAFCNLHHALVHLEDYPEPGVKQTIVEIPALGSTVRKHTPKGDSRP